MVRFFSVFTIMCGALISTAVIADQETLKIATYRDFPPFVTDNLPGGGIVNEIVAASFATADVDIELQYIPWKRSYRAVSRGEVLASFSWAYSEDRAKDFHFSAPLFMIANRLLTTLPTLKDWTTLKQESAPDNSIILCTPLGWKIADELEALIDNNVITLMAPSRPRSCMELMRAQRTDLIYMPQITASYHLNAIIAEEENYPARAWPEIFSIDIPSGNDNTQHVIFTKNEAGAAYKKRFDIGFKKIVADGTYRAILERFLITLGEDERTKIMKDQIDAGIMPATP